MPSSEGRVQSTVKATPVAVVALAAFYTFDDVSISGRVCKKAVPVGPLKSFQLDRGGWFIIYAGCWLVDTNQCYILISGEGFCTFAGAGPLDSQPQR